MHSTNDSVATNPESPFWAVRRVTPPDHHTDLLVATDRQADVFAAQLKATRTEDLSQQSTRKKDQTGAKRWLDALQQLNQLTIRFDDRYLTAPSLVFWNHTTWVIAIRATANADEWLHRALHAIKHIIDYPKQQGLYSAKVSAIRHQHAKAETLADRFADRVIQRLEDNQTSMPATTTPNQSKCSSTRLQNQHDTKSTTSKWRTHRRTVDTSERTQQTTHAHRPTSDPSTAGRN